MKICSIPLKSKQSAAAIVSVLIVVSILTILVIAYLSTMRIEHQSAVSFADTQRAKMVAQGAVAHSIDLLRTHIPEPAGIEQSAETASARNWIINPGRLTIIDDEGKEQIVPLHTGSADRDPDDTVDPDVDSVDLNEPIPGNVDYNDEPIPTITYALNDDGTTASGQAPPKMRVKWVNLLQDPSKEASQDNPIVARHAFWIDDESGKINFNTSLGKPDPEKDEHFERQLESRMMPPLFSAGEKSSSTNLNNTGKRKFGLGNLRSVNLDVLFEDPDVLKEDQLMAHGFLRGFSRYPEAILDYVEIEDLNEKSKWWNQNRYNLTFYSRSPEFNAFGKPRLMTTQIPLSLEGGPSYQMPFVYRDEENPVSSTARLKGVLHLSALMGSLGNASVRNIRDNRKEGQVKDLSTDVPDGARTLPSNVVNRAQLAMLMRYMNRKFPGYSQSFVDKYGEVECAQIALNILSMSVFATTQMEMAGNKTHIFAEDYSDRSASTNFFPSSRQQVGHTPERHYWRYKIGEGFLANLPDLDSPPDPDVTLMLPVSPGPFITEVRMILQPQFASQVNPGDKPQKWLSVKFEVEYFMPDVGASLYLRKFPFKVDYFRVKQGEEIIQNLGSADDPGPNKNWDYSFHDRDKGPEPPQIGLGALRIQYSEYVNLKIHASRRIMARGPTTYLGKELTKLGNTPDSRKRFDIDEKISFKVGFRGGMGRDSFAGNIRKKRPKHPRGPDPNPLQMIPLGITDDDILEEKIEVDMSTSSPVSISWEIEDPRLSSMKDQWQADVKDDGSAGTPGKINTNEPENDSSEKSKFRFIQRGHGVWQGLKIERPDEFSSASRVSSKGFWSFIHTGVQREKAWQSILLAPPSSDLPPPPGGSHSDCPDWLLFDLMGATYPMQREQWKINSTLPDEFSTVSYMNSTTGAINLNTKTYPDDSDYFAAPARVKPLEAVFKHLRSDSELDTFLDEVKSYQEDDHFDYVGEMTEVPGYASGETQWEKEALLRNMIGCLTTRSNTFGVWGVGQVVKKSRRNTDAETPKWGEFEDGDSVRGEKRFFALVERYIWAGKDGVPGNAHVMNGEWDRTAMPPTDPPVSDRLFQLPGSPPSFLRRKVLRINTKGTYPMYDGPQEVEMDLYASRALGKIAWTHSPLKEAYNPPQAVIKYRVVYFKYLDE